MPFKNPLRRWRRIELPPVDAPLPPGESRMIQCVYLSCLAYQDVTLPVTLWSSLPTSHWNLKARSSTMGVMGCLLHSWFVMCACILAR
jgi:hypothetical protein